VATQHAASEEISASMENAVRALLEHGADPNEEIFISRYDLDHFKEGVARRLCKPLHVASTMSLIQLLLEFKADVNGLNGLQQTPLDVWFSDGNEMPNAKRAYECIEILLAYGGKITRPANHRHFIAMLARSYDLDDRFWNPPVLQLSDATLEFGPVCPNFHLLQRGTSNDSPQVVQVVEEPRQDSRSISKRKFTNS
jgi:hypothetical protein